MEVKTSRELFNAAPEMAQLLEDVLIMIDDAIPINTFNWSSTAAEIRTVLTNAGVLKS